MNNNPQIPLLPPPNSSRPQIVQQFIHPPTVRGHRPIYPNVNHYQPQILNRSQSFSYPAQPPQYQHQPYRPPPQYTVPRPQPISYHQSYPSTFSPNTNHKNNNNSNTNSYKKPSKNDVIQINDFCVDKNPNNYINYSTPHYKVFNEIPIPFIQTKTKKSKLRNCFNCGNNRHAARDCIYPKDNNCVNFNRYLFEKYGTSNSNSGNKKYKMSKLKQQAFKYKRYYETESLVRNISSASTNTNNSKNSNDSNVFSDSNYISNNTNNEKSFDDVLKMVQKNNEQDNDDNDNKENKDNNNDGNDGHESGEITDNEQNNNNEIEQKQEEKEEKKEIILIEVEKEIEMEVEKEKEEEEEEEALKLGFKFDDEIECLEIFRTREDIEAAQKEYKKRNNINCSGKGDRD
eukprot:14773_1